MKRLLLITLSILAMNSFQAQSLDTTLHYNCGGNLKVACEKRGKIQWMTRSYHFNGFINVAIRNGVVINEVKNFVRSGYISRGRQPRLVGLTMDGKYLLYESAEFFFRFPLEGYEPVMFAQKFNRPIGNDGSTYLWQELCSSTP
jgi:hypothetical protein